MPTFIPPTENIVPALLAGMDESEKSPMKFWETGNPRGINVWWDTYDQISTTQPRYWQPYTDQNGNQYPGVKKFFRGGTKNKITEAEAVILRAAGYGAYIFEDAIFGTSTYGGGDQYA